MLVKIHEIVALLAVIDATHAFSSFMGRPLLTRWGLSSKVTQKLPVKLSDRSQLQLASTTSGSKSDEKFLDFEFAKLAEGKNAVGFFQVLNWEEIKDLLEEEVLTMEEISDFWQKATGGLNEKANRETFGKFNAIIDKRLDQMELEDEGAVAEDENEDELIDPADLDIWDPTFDPTTVFDKDSLLEITDYFTATAGSIEGDLSYRDFLEWPDVQDMLSDGSIAKDDLQQAWNEAATGPGENISYDTFLRLNVRMDLILDENEEIESLEPAENELKEPVDGAPSAEKFYRDEYQKVTGSSPIMTLDMLLSWDDIAELVDDGAVTKEQIQKLFNGMPKEVTADQSGISEDSFVAFNSMLDVLIEAASPADSVAVTKAATPSVLVSEPERPMPAKDSELKIGSLGESEDSTTGLSEIELEELQKLDQADNMLNSGSYGDFDQLIGDLNDPRLQALREEREGAEEVSGELKELIDELLDICGSQGRCGLDRPSDEDATRIRDLIQGIIEKSPPIADTKSIDEIRGSVNGRWKLLYSNSEMFDFYNGVTGFANVFPASKFQGLSFEYASDGYLSESKYFETLSTPLGTLDATVFANWDLVKEMSFMTNKNSIVLRNYCNKVIAGPMEYLAEENWKSLRTVAMNEIVYIDDRIKICRNCGALRIYFVFIRE